VRNYQLFNVIVGFSVIVSADESFRGDFGWKFLILNSARVKFAAAAVELELTWNFLSLWHFLVLIFIFDVY
jgi:hypothetical protein